MSGTPLFMVGGKRIVVAAAALVVFAVGLATGARAADPPIGTIGVTSPDGSQTASGTAGSGGEADACLNGQHSGTSPNASNPSGAAQVNDGACSAGGGSQSTSGAGGSQGSGSANVTGSTGSAGAASGASGSTTRAWVSASGARGLRIVRVQYFTNDIAVTKRLRVLVTLRDLNGRRVRTAIVSIGPVAGARRTVAGTTSTFSNRLGQARLVLTATKPMLGRRLLLRITARTPTVRAVTVGSVLLPRVAPQ